eukprot:5166501-Pyramimonas_sp.AAC.1
MRSVPCACWLVPWLGPRRQLPSLQRWRCKTIRGMTPWTRPRWGCLVCAPRCYGGAKLNLVRLPQAWKVMVMHQRMACAESWSKVTGPLPAMWMALRRADWSMKPACEVIADESCRLSLLEVAPRDFRDLLGEG